MLLDLLGFDAPKKMCPSVSLKFRCQSERYRLASDGMKTLLGFLSVIAVELLHVTEGLLKKSKNRERGLIYEIKASKT